LKPDGKDGKLHPLNTLLDQVLKQIRDDAVLTWPEKLKGDPSKRPRNKYCRFHRDHGHDTSECYDLKQQIENLPRDPEPNRRAEERPKALLGEIRIIVEGNTIGGSSKKARKTYLRMVQSVQISRWPPKLARVDNPVISFIEDDAR